MTLNKEIGSRLTPKRVFCLGLVVLVTLTLIQLPLYDGRAFFSLLHPYPDDTFMDFFNSVWEAVESSDPYVERGVIYPPLTYLFYRLCGLVLPAAGSALQMRSNQQGLVLITVLTVVTLAALYKVLLPENPTERDKRLVKWLLLGTVPFWFAIERGNLVLQCLVFLAYFVRNYRSDDRVKREFALISLAVATACKIYPVFFGVLLLLNRQFRDAVRCLIYGAVLFFLPFVFVGGLDRVPVMVQNILRCGDVMIARGWGFKVDLGNTLRFLAEAFHVGVRGTRWGKVIVAALALFVLVFTRSHWQKLMALVCGVVLLPEFSYTYTLILAMIPLMAFFEEAPQSSLKNLLYSLLFLGMLAPFPLDGVKLFDEAPLHALALNLTTVVSSLCLPAMLLLMTWDTAARRFLAGRSGFLGKLSTALEVTGPKAVKCLVAVVITVFVLAVACYFYCDSLYISDMMS